MCESIVQNKLERESFEGRNNTSKQKENQRKRERKRRTDRKKKMGDDREYSGGRLKILVGKFFF